MIDFQLFRRCSDGSLSLITYHPRSSPTWHWSVSLTRRQRWLKNLVSLDENRRFQWHDYIKLPFGWAICIGYQDCHRAARRAVRLWSARPVRLAAYATGRALSKMGERTASIGVRLMAWAVKS